MFKKGEAVVLPDSNAIGHVDQVINGDLVRVRLNKPDAVGERYGVFRAVDLRAYATRQELDPRGPRS
jgi:hypothetical protein